MNAEATNDVASVSVSVRMGDVCGGVVWAYIVSRKKGATLFFAITLPNPNRSSKFVYRHTQQ